MSSSESEGIVTAVRGSVVDARFESDLPRRLNCLRIPGAMEMILEVQLHLDPHTVRAVALNSTRGLAPGSVRRIAVTVREKLVTLDTWRAQHGLASLALCYNHHTRRGSYRSVCVPVLPVDLQRLSGRGSRVWPSRGLPVHTLPAARLRAALVRQYVFVCVFRACAESQASEHGSRLLAMQAAEKNLGQRIDEVVAEHRRARQANVTAELLDVVSGYEALAADNRE